MKYFNKPRKGRAHRAQPQNEFERALRGLDESEERSPFDPAADRKTLQLCRQVQRALALELDDVSIESVHPLGGASQLLVRVIVAPGDSPLEVMSRLTDRTPALRAAIAQAICRKRVPMLTFIAVPAEGGDHA